MRNSSPDYYQGFKLCLDNARNHIKVAELSENISYGIAHAHIVLASEEAIKAVMLFNIHKDKSALDKMTDFQKYFSDHKHKPDEIRNFEKVALLLEKMLMTVMNPLLGIEPRSISLEEVKRKVSEGINNLIKWFENETKTPTLQTNDQWWKQAESFKQEGFYVNLLKKRGEWSSPHKCSKKKYDKGKKVVLEFIGKIELVEEYLMNPEMEEFYLEMMNEIKTVQ
jgi:AbiV family abortive infection protein